MIEAVVGQVFVRLEAPFALPSVVPVCPPLFFPAVVSPHPPIMNRQVGCGVTLHLLSFVLKAWFTDEVSHGWASEPAAPSLLEKMRSRLLDLNCGLKSESELT